MCTCVSKRFHYQGGLLIQPGATTFLILERRSEMVLGLRSTRGLVDLKRVDRPVSLAHVGIVAEVSRAGALAGHRLARLGLTVHGIVPDGAGPSPVSTDGVGEDDDVVVEVVVHVALACRPVGHGGAPVGRVGRARADVAWDRAFGEEVGRDAFRVGPVHDVNTTTVLVVLNTIVAALGRSYTATLVAGSIGSAIVGIVVLECELARHLDIGGNSAAAGGVDRVGIVGIVIDALDNVDLASVGPAAGGAGGGRPPSRPDTTANRHVLGVEDKDTGGEGVLGIDADGLGPAIVGSDLHGSLAIRGADETLVLRLALADVADGTVGRVGVGEEVHVVKEAGALVGLDQFPLRSGSGGRRGRGGG